MRGFLMMVRLAWPNFLVLVAVLLLAVACQRIEQPPASVSGQEQEFPDTFRVISIHRGPGQSIEAVVFCDTKTGAYVYWNPEGGIDAYWAGEACR